MSIEYLGLSSVNGPLVVLEGVQDAFFDEIVEFVIDGSERKIGRIVVAYEYPHEADRTSHGDCSVTGYAGTDLQRDRSAH